MSKQFFGTKYPGVTEKPKKPKGNPEANYPETG